MLRLRAAEISLFCFLLFSPDSPSMDARQVFEGVASSTVQIQSLDSAGSGIVLNEAGLILTNYHVVAVEVDLKVRARIRLAGKVVLTELDDVTVTKLHPKYDLALLQAKLPKGATTIPARIIPQQIQLAPGSKCFVIGNPGGVAGTTLDLSITEGIVSSTSRQVEGLDYAQVSAAINPGNSGGPVCDDQGRVFGITTWKMSQAEGIGFAIPTQKLNLADFTDKKSRKPDLTAAREAEALGRKYLEVARLGDPSQRREALLASAECFRASLNAAPNDPAPYLNLSVSLRELGEDAYAKKYLEAALKAFPNNARVCHFYGALVVKDRESDKALYNQCLEIWLRGLGTDPNKIEASFCAEDIAICLVNQKNYLPAAYMFRWSETLRRELDNDPLEARRARAWETIAKELPPATIETLRAKQSDFSRAEFAALSAGRPLPPNPSVKAMPPLAGGAVPATGSNITPTQMDGLIKNAQKKFGPTVVAVPPEGLECPLPDIPGESLLANNGWQLVLFFPDLAKIGVFNLATGRIDGFIDAPDRQSLFAAGGQILAAYSPSSKELSLFDLATLKQISTRKSPVPGTISYLGMGLLNPTRLFLIYRKSENSPALPALLKIPDFTEIVVGTAKGESNIWEVSGAGNHEEGAMDLAGTFAVLTRRGVSPGGLARYQIRDGTSFDLKYAHVSPGVPAILYPGNLILAQYDAHDAADLKSIPYAKTAERFDTNRFASVIGYPGVIDLHLSPESTAGFRVWSVPDMTVLIAHPLPPQSAQKLNRASAKLIASAFADRVAVLQAEQKKLILFPLGIKDGAAAGGFAEPGKHFERKLNLPAGAKIVLQSGPPGLGYDAKAGALIWDVPASTAKKQVIQVILLVTDADSKESYVVEKIYIL